MKQINTYINEKLRLSAKLQYTCQPKDEYELTQIIIGRIRDEGPECDLNDIDVSKITDMSGLFDASSNKAFKKFNGNISLWNVSNVKYMRNMFFRCTKFNCDISMWDVSNVEGMYGMFGECGRFNRDLSTWDVSNVENMSYMFSGCKQFNCDLSKWNVSNVKYMNYMFYECEKFNQDVDSWNVPKIEFMINAFYKCPTTPKWYDKKQWE